MLLFILEPRKTPVVLLSVCYSTMLPCMPAFSVCHTKIIIVIKETAGITAVIGSIVPMSTTCGIHCSVASLVEQCFRKYEKDN